LECKLTDPLRGFFQHQLSFLFTMWEQPDTFVIVAVQCVLLVQ